MPNGSLQRRKGRRKGGCSKTEGFLEEAMTKAYLKADCLSSSWVVTSDLEPAFQTHLMGSSQLGLYTGFLVIQTLEDTHTCTQTLTCLEKSAPLAKPI